MGKVNHARDITEESAWHILRQEYQICLRTHGLIEARGIAMMDLCPSTEQKPGTVLSQWAMAVPLTPFVLFPYVEMLGTFSLRDRIEETMSNTKQQ